MIASLMSYEALGIYSIAFFMEALWMAYAGQFLKHYRQFANLWNENNTEAMQKCTGVLQEYL